MNNQNHGKCEIESEIDDTTLENILRQCAVTKPGHDGTSTMINDALTAIGRDRIGRSRLKTNTRVKVRMGNARPVHGGMGQIWPAIDEYGRRVAVKIIRYEKRGTEFEQRFANEAKITASLSHPNIITIYGVGLLADGSRFYTMPFIKGQTLEKAIKRRKRSLRDLLRQFVHVCHAIQYAHGRHTVHRDLKPANILLSQHDVAYVIDWGLAKRIGKRELPSLEADSPRSDDPIGTTIGTRIGTPQFMSPEQASGGEVGPWTDVFCLGATLYSILTGKSPYPGTKDENETLAIIDRVKRADFIPPSRVPGASVPAALEAICLKAMAKEKKQRYRAVDEMRHDIERWLAGDGVSVFNDPLPVRIMRKARKRPTLFVTFGLTVLLGTMAIGLDRLRAHYAAAELLAANEDLNARLEELASSQQKLGAELYQRGEKLRALNEIANAVRAAERKFRNEPSLDNEVKYLQAAAGLSLLQHKTDQKELALITSEGVYSRLHELIGQNPENVGLLRLKVLLLGNRGMTDLALRQPGESPTVAVATYKEALEVLRQIQMLEPVEERDATQREFARINGNLADALAETHDHEQELVHRRTAIAILKEMVAKGDSAGPFLGVHVVRLASQLFELNRTEEAIAELRAATDVFPYIEAGEPENWGQQLNAAKCLVRMADTETETTISDKYRHRAMEVLVSMQNRGFFVKHPQLAEVIETDPLLSSLRDRPDYMQLLSRVHADFRK